MKFKEQAIRQSTKIVSLPAIYSPRCDKAIFNHLIIKTMIRLNVLKEEGCIAYDTFESSTRHDVFMICETWQNAEVLATHEKSPHFGKYVGIIQELAEMKLEKFEF